jgi:hypothetical protein
MGGVMRLVADNFRISRHPQGRVKVAQKAALPSRARGMRKAAGFPAQTASLLPLGSAGGPSLACRESFRSRVVSLQIDGESSAARLNPSEGRSSPEALLF